MLRNFNAGLLQHFGGSCILLLGFFQVERLSLGSACLQRAFFWASFRPS
jgi:hypothetical protein